MAFDYGTADKSLTRQQVCSEVAKRLNVTTAYVHQVIDTFMDVCRECLENHIAVSLYPFVYVTTHLVKAREYKFFNVKTQQNEVREHSDRYLLKATFFYRTKKEIERAINGETRIK